MKIKTSELIGPALDWAVAICEGEPIRHDPMGFGHTANGGYWVWYATPGSMQIGKDYSPSTIWSQGGPITDLERISVRTYARKGHPWVAFIDFGGSSVSGVKAKQYGPTSLIAAMRCYVASKLGDEVEIPEELT